MFHYDNGHIYDCDKCRVKEIVGKIPSGCIHHPEYKPSPNNYPCDKDGRKIQ